MTTVTIVSGSSADPAGTARILPDLIWSHAGPADGLEHVTATGHETGIDLVFFTVDRRPPSTADPRELCLRVIQASGLLSGWRVG